MGSSQIPFSDNVGIHEQTTCNDMISHNRTDMDSAYAGTLGRNEQVAPRYLWADGPDFSGSNVTYEGPGPPCRLKTCLSGSEKGHFALTRRTSDYLNEGNSPI